MRLTSKLPLSCPKTRFRPWATNRNISSDSRSRGAFPMEDVIGVVKAKGMGLVYAVIAVLAVLLAVFLVADAVKTKRAEAVRVGRGEKRQRKRGRKRRV